MPIALFGVRGADKINDDVVISLLTDKHIEDDVVVSVSHPNYTLTGEEIAAIGDLSSLMFHQGMASWRLCAHADEQEHDAVLGVTTTLYDDIAQEQIAAISNVLDADSGDRVIAIQHEAYDDVIWFTEPARK
jgi:hypothetical protein